MSIAVNVRIPVFMKPKSQTLNPSKNAVEIGSYLISFVGGFVSILAQYRSYVYILCGEQVNTERSIRHAMQERLPIVVVINKVCGFFNFSYYVCYSVSLLTILYCSTMGRKRFLLCFSISLI